MTLTRHARVRAAQRGIPLDALHAARDYGDPVWQDGAVVYFISNRAVSRAARDGVDLRRHRGVTVVVSNDGAPPTVVTVYRTVAAPRSRRHRGVPRRTNRR